MGLLAWRDAALAANASDEAAVSDLAVALKDAQIALKYAVETGKEISLESVRNIICLRRKLEHEPDAISADDEAAFWVAAAEIARAIKPVKVAALAERYAYETHHRRSRIRHVLRWYLVGIWAVLAATVVIHLFYVSLDGSIQRAQEAAQAFDASRDALRQLHFGNEAAGRGDDAVAQAVRIQRQIQCSSLRAWTDEIEQLRWLPGNRASPLPEAQDDFVAAAYRCSRANNYRPTDAMSSVGEAQEREQRDSVVALEFGRNIGLGSAPAWAILRSAERWRGVLIKFILPLLYGLLGAMAGVVLLVRGDITRLQFVPTSMPSYTLRLPLGALAGGTAGLLLDPQTLASVAGVTALGFAFGLGYGVETFFTTFDGLIDRISTALSSRSPREGAARPGKEG